MFKVLFILCTTSFVACSQNKKTDDTINEEVLNQKSEVIHTEPHKYGGWYCPDNLNGFPPVDITNWKNVPL